MYKYTSQKNEKDSKAENKVNNRDKSDFSISNSICQKTHDTPVRDNRVFYTI